MPINKLSARQCALTPGKAMTLCDGGNLYFERHDSGAAFWSFRYRSPISKRARYLGLGPVHTVGLAEARLAALECRKLLREGKDPQHEARAAKAARQEAREADQCSSKHFS